MRPTWDGMIVKFCPLRQARKRRSGAMIERNQKMKSAVVPGALAAALLIGLTSCTNPYDPAQRAVGGGLLGAGAGAAIGAAAGGGRGAATGALVGGALGAVGGAATTPSPYGYGYCPPPYYGGYGYYPYYPY
jgi:hypothetical protein